MPGTPRVRGSMLLVGLAVFASALIIAVLRVTSLSDLFGLRLSMPWAMNDFRNAVYCPAAIFLEGGNPYDRAEFLRFCPMRDAFPLYAPATLLLHAPFGLLSFGTAAVLYFCLTIVLSVAVVFVALRLAGAESPVGKLLLGAGLLLLSRPGQWNLLLGQPALELVLATYAALAWSRRAPMLGGFALAVAAYKPTFGIPLGVLMLVRGDRRAVRVGVLAALILNVAPLAVLIDRAGGLSVFVQDLIRSHRAWEGVIDPSQQVYNVDAPGFVARLVRHRLGPPTYLVVSLAVLGAAGVALRSLGRREDRMDDRLSGSIICLAMLLSVHHLAYDLVLLVFPVAALAMSALPQDFLVSRRRVLLVLVFLLGANYVTTQSALARLERHTGAWLVLASLNGALLAGMFLVYLTGSIGRRRAGVPVAAPVPLR